MPMTLLYVLEMTWKIARNMKLLLYGYEMIPGLKINFTKSEVNLINGDEDKCTF